jgi:hypothetical protein
MERAISYRSHTSVPALLELRIHRTFLILHSAHAWVLALSSAAVSLAMTTNYVEPTPPGVGMRAMRSTRDAEEMNSFYICGQSSLAGVSRPATSSAGVCVPFFSLRLWKLGVRAYGFVSAPRSPDAGCARVCLIISHLPSQPVAAQLSLHVTWLGLASRWPLSVLRRPPRS